MCPNFLQSSTFQQSIATLRGFTMWPHLVWTVAFSQRNSRSCFSCLSALIPTLSCTSKRARKGSVRLLALLTHFTVDCLFIVISTVNLHTLMTLDSIYNWSLVKRCFVVTFRSWAKRNFHWCYTKMLDSLRWDIKRSSITPNAVS